MKGPRPFSHLGRGQGATASDHHPGHAERDVTRRAPLGSPSRQGERGCTGQRCTPHAARPGFPNPWPRSAAARRPDESASMDDMTSNPQATPGPVDDPASPHRAVVARDHGHREPDPDSFSDGGRHDAPRKAWPTASCCPKGAGILTWAPSPAGLGHNLAA